MAPNALTLVIGNSTYPGFRLFCDLFRGLYESKVIKIQEELLYAVFIRVWCFLRVRNLS